MDCSLCYESFTEEGPSTPRTLDCGHTFCTRCIQMLNQTATPRQGPKCPECRAFIRFNRRAATNFPKNYKLLELIREKTQPTPKPGADTSQEYRDHRGLDATDPSSFAPPPEEERGPLGGEPPGLNAEDPDVYFNFGWGNRSGGGPELHRPENQGPATFLEWMARGWQTRPVQPNANPPNSELWLYGFDPPTSATGTGPTGTGSSSHANRATSNTGGGSNAQQQLSMINRPNPHADMPATAIANGRAVQISEGFLVCKFFQEGTCRYGPYCWFRHPCINQNKALCKHWQKGQCRRGVGCSFRHGTRVPIRPRNRNRNRARPNRLGNPPSGANDGAPGPSGASSSTAMEGRGLGSQSVVLVSGNSFSIMQGGEVSGPSPSAGSTSLQPSSESTSPFDSLNFESDEGWYA
ncbi:hypothetical protein BSKO_11467 [Bryopsis sp. KO-2023]|nr:hypothetical protein BSKO_11467 [Bryopsis sp. KO-2023]